MSLTKLSKFLFFNVILAFSINLHALEPSSAIIASLQNRLKQLAQDSSIMHLIFPGNNNAFINERVEELPHLLQSYNSDKCEMYSSATKLAIMLALILAKKFIIDYANRGSKKAKDFFITEGSDCHSSSASVIEANAEDKSKPSLNFANIFKVFYVGCMLYFAYGAWNNKSLAQESKDKFNDIYNVIGSLIMRAEARAKIIRETKLNIQLSALNDIEMCMSRQIEAWNKRYNRVIVVKDIDWKVLIAQRLGWIKP
jgi:hypothetical protein